jgi:hypothetical protein
VRARREVKNEASDEAYHASWMLRLHQHEIAGRVAERAYHLGRRCEARKRPKGAKGSSGAIAC